MRKAHVVGFCTLLTIAVAGAPSIAHADDQQAAAESFRAGASSFEKGDFRTAAGNFERAFKLAPHGSPMYNAGLAWESAHEPARAADAYQLALETPGLNDKQKADAQTRLASLEKTLGRVEVSGPAGTTISVAHIERSQLPAKFHLVSGQYDMTVQRPNGREETQTIGVAAGASVPITVNPPQAPPTKAEELPPPEPKKTEEPSGGIGGKRVLGIAAAAGGVVLVGVGVVVGMSALDARDRFNASGHTDKTAHDDAASGRTLANVCIIGGVVLGAVGAYLIFTGKPSAAPAPTAAGTFFKPEVGVGVGLGQARLRVRF